MPAGKGIDHISILAEELGQAPRLLDHGDWVLIERAMDCDEYHYHASAVLCIVSACSGNESSSAKNKAWMGNNPIMIQMILQLLKHERGGVYLNPEVRCHAIDAIVALCCGVGAVDRQTVLIKSGALSSILGLLTNQDTSIRSHSLSALVHFLQDEAQLSSTNYMQDELIKFPDVIGDLVEMVRLETDAAMRDNANIALYWAMTAKQGPHIKNQDQLALTTNSMQTLVTQFMQLRPKNISLAVLHAAVRGGHRQNMAALLEAQPSPLPELTRVAAEGAGGGDKNTKYCANYASCIYAELLKPSAQTENRPHPLVIEQLMRNRNGELDAWIQLLKSTQDRQGDQHCENLRLRAAAVIHWVLCGADAATNREPQDMMAKKEIVPLLARLLHDENSPAIPYAAGSIRWFCAGRNKVNQDTVSSVPNIMDRLVNALRIPTYRSYVAGAIAEACHGPHEANIKALASVRHAESELRNAVRDATEESTKRNAEACLGELARAPYVKAG